MAYRVVFSDRTQVSVTQEQGEKLMQLQSAVTKPAYVNIAGSQYKLSSITKVIHTPDQLKTLPMIDSGMVKRCEGSIHREIKRRFGIERKTKEKPRKWDVFKPAAYAYLHSDKYFDNERGGVRTEWCDYTTVGCICKDKKEITTADVKEVMKIMRS